MTRETPSYLKLHTEPNSAVTGPRIDDLRGLDTLCQAFHDVTGWNLRVLPRQIPEAATVWSAPIATENGPAPGSLVLQRASASPTGPERPTDLEKARQLASALGGLVSQLWQVRLALWQREAELAAGVPITPRPDEQVHLAARLEAILRSGAEAVECQAAAVYLLDESTSHLKLRSCIGLPPERLLAAPRPLRGAIADLEALLGHAVVLDDAARLPQWNAPEKFASAVCVPISSPTMPLGTLWVFCDRPREFTAQQVGWLEIIAGRVASELEREMLLHEQVRTRQMERQMEAAAQWQQDRMPRITPLLDNWQMAGWTSQAETLGGDLHDWFVLPDGMLGFCVGSAGNKLLEAALTSATLHASVKAHSNYRHDAQQMLERVNETLWSASTGDQFAALFYGQVQPEGGQLKYCAVGQVAAVLVGHQRHEILAGDQMPLGSVPDARYVPGRTSLRKGELLLVFSDGVRKTLGEPDYHKCGARLAAALPPVRELSPGQVVERLRKMLAETCPDPAVDQTLLVLKRRA